MTLDLEWHREGSLQAVPRPAIDSPAMYSNTHRRPWPRRLMFALVALLAVLAVSCSGTASEPAERPPEPAVSASAPVLVAEADADVIPLSYLIRQRQLAAANAILAWFRDVNPNPPGIGTLDTHAWTRDRQSIAEPDTGGAGYDFEVLFGFSGFDPDASDYDWGDTSVVADRVVDHPNQTLLLDNTHNSTPLDIDLTRSVVLHNSSSTSTTHRISVDIGAKLGATLGGEATGGKIEAEISTNLGIENTNTTINTSASDTTQSVTVKTTVAAHAATLAEIASPQVTQQTGFTVDGAIDGWIEIIINDELFANYWEQFCSGPRYHQDGARRVVHFNSFDDLYAAIRGFNVDFPGREDSPLFPEHIASIEAARRLQWAGKVTNVTENSATVRFSDVTDPAAAIAEHSIPTDRVIR